MTSRPIPLLLVALLLLSSLAPLASAGEAWTKETGSAITAVATDERGDRIFVGTEGGDLYCYDASGNVVWSRPSLHGGGITKILASDDGAYVTALFPEAFYLLDGGTGSGITSYSATMRDVATPRNGSLHIMSYGSIDIQDADGRIFRTPAPTINQIAMDGSGEWLVGGGGSTLTLYALAIPDSDNWLRPWPYRSAHTLIGTLASAQTDTLVMINVTRATGTSTAHTLYAPQCRVDFADIRFTASDGVTQLPYRHYATTGTTATFLVQVPTIPASPGTTTIYAYWGWGSTSASDPSLGADIYIFDDFNDGTIDTSIWTVTTANGATAVESGGYLTLNTNGYPQTPAVATVQGPTIPAGYGALITASVKLPTTYQDNFYNYKEHFLFSSSGGFPGIRSQEYDGHQTQLYWPGNWTGLLATYNSYITHQIAVTPSETRWVAGSDWDETASIAATSVMLRVGNPQRTYGCGHMQIDSISITPLAAPEMHGAWGPVESIITLQDTKTLDGTIIDIDAPETGDWVAVSTTTKTYIIEITDSGFGTVYSADRTGTPYDVAIANNGANIIEGRGILADIFRFDGVQVGTYTAGGPVRAVAIAQKNGLYAAAGSDDGKYYIFSKDESSSWYLLHASDSEDPVTAIAMSWRGEIAVIGRADGSVVLYKTTDAPPPDSQMTVYIIKDGKPYIGKTVSVSTADISDPDEWTPLYSILRTDSDGKIVISTHTGHYYQININNGEKIVVIQASSATPIHSVVFRSPLIYEKYSYDVQYNASSQAIEMTYTDNEGPATVSWSIVRTDTYSEVFSHTTSGVTTATATYPISEPDISYKVNVKVQRSSGSIQNTWFITPQNASPIALPFWDENIQNAVFIIFLMILGGVFYYSTGAKGALIVALLAALFRYFSWITVPWFWIIAAVVFAFLANIAEGA